MNLEWPSYRWFEPKRRQVGALQMTGAQASSLASVVISGEGQPGRLRSSHYAPDFISADTFRRR
jgi:hypothetical protein